jgi:type IV secretory pathway TraG/TraD family ATPase VirD4
LRSFANSFLEQTSVWAYQRLHRVTYKASETENDLEPAPNDFSFEQLRDGNTSLYLIIPPDYLTEYRAVLRAMVGCAIRELRLSFVNHRNSDVSQEKPPVLFILDEFPQLAYMQPIEEALLYLAGYDVRFWFFVQNISQLQLHYKNSWQSFFANTGTQCFFGVSDISTANLVSEMAGTTTTHHYSINFNSSSLGDPLFYQNPLCYRSKYDDAYHVTRLANATEITEFFTSSKDGEIYTFEHQKLESEKVTYHYRTLPTAGKLLSIAGTSIPRRLITPDEVLRLKENEQIIFMKGVKPIFSYRVSYHEIESCNNESNTPPPYNVDFL